MSPHTGHSQQIARGGEPGGLELGDRRDDRDLGSNHGPIERIVERGGRSLAGKSCRRERPIARQIDLLGSLTNADDYWGVIVRRSLPIVHSAGAPDSGRDRRR